MARTRESVKQAEEQAYAGENESQDSQWIMDQYHLMYGVGILSSSPPPTELQLTANGCLPVTRSRGLNSRADSGRSKAAKELNEPPKDALKPKTRINPVPVPASQQASKHSSAAPRSSLTWEPDGKQVPLPASLHGHVAIQAPSPLIRDDVLPQVPRSTAPLKWDKKMDGSMSESPTQSNDGRSYEQYRENVDRPLNSSQPAGEKDHVAQFDRPSQLSAASSSHEQRSLHEDETGAVKFDWHPPEGDSDGDEFEENDDTTDPPFPTSQPAATSQLSAVVAAAGRHSMPASTMPPPETPTVAHRLFSRDAAPGNVMAASQLFMQTQFTSGVKKLASPTSSRPSPNILEHNTISPNNRSSPLKDRGLRTSPIQGFSTSPIAAAPATSSKVVEQQHLETETIPGSPAVVQSRQRTRRDPIGDYAPIRNSATSDPGLNTEIGAQTDSDSDESQQRRRLVKLKQERANRSLTSISFPRKNKREKVEVPSTNHKTQKGLTQSTASALSSPDDYVAQCHGKPDTTDNDESQETVADSQEAGATNGVVIHPIISSSAVKETHGMHTQVVTQPELPVGPRRSNETTGSKETIPETSPAGNRRSSRKAKTSLGRTVVTQQPFRSSGRIAQADRPSSDETRVLPSSPPVPVPIVVSSQKSRRSARLGIVATPVTSSTSPTLEQPASTSSTLTVLTETPRISSSATPNTEPAEQDPVQDETSSPVINITAVSSPAAAKNLRQKPSKLKTYSSPRVRGSDRPHKTTRHPSVSTDELALSTPTSASRSRPSRSFARKSTTSLDSRQPPSSAGIFHGMTFATSFQAEGDKKSVEKMIVSAGGTIISRGFDELVEVPPLESNKKPGLRSGQNTGFAALITDTHSRKPKYMQALALGLPCLSWKWISSCVRGNAIVDWSTYLLCAGQSQVLGAIRSRTLESYDATDVNIEDIIEKRSRLFRNAQILLVMKRSKKEEEKRMQYVFLAQVLGASLLRVSTLDEARTVLRKKEESGESFDWVYVDGHQVDADKILFGQGQPISKKRKRQSTTDSSDDPAPKRIRTMTDELVVQSLILGRLVGDGEMEDAFP
ncbi:hypothetical protein SUNI508_00133 [Seiridium unicorne]|uniref:BRCT domain-containing protein n=1 Tax=Seiridium unicorne TaxID=138068 RepID=A0ABR2VIJ8_9PEZI